MKAVSAPQLNGVHPVVRNDPNARGTSDAALFLHREKEFGTVTVGLRADFRFSPPIHWRMWGMSRNGLG